MMKIVDLPSPNFNDRASGKTPYLIILHYTGMPDTQSALDRLCDSKSEVSAHYTIDEDGTIYHMVDESKRAWHAGKSVWQGETDINSVSIGIEIINGGHEENFPPFQPIQIESCAALIRDIRTRHTIPAENILGHSDVAPGRKQDPGPRFPWEHLKSLL